MEPTKTTTKIAKTILTPSTQSVELSSAMVVDKIIWTTAEAINIRTIKSSKDSHTNIQKWGTSSAKTLLLPKVSSLPLVLDIPFSLSVFRDWNNFSGPPFSSKYFISWYSEPRSLYLLIIFSNSIASIPNPNIDGSTLLSLLLLPSLSFCSGIISILFPTATVLFEPEPIFGSFFFDNALSFFNINVDALLFSDICLIYL